MIFIDEEKEVLIKDVEYISHSYVRLREGITIKSKRVKKYKNKSRRLRNKKLIVLVQVAMINYSILTAGAYLTSPTNAAFNDVTTIMNSIQAGQWEEKQAGWDKSSLEFIGQGSENQGTQLTIFASIQNGNGSSAMEGPVKYEVYWADKGNPKKGVIVAEGLVEALGTGSASKLIYTPIQSGNYMFKAYQRPGHPGKGELWSESISVDSRMLQAQVMLITMPEIIATDADLEAVANGIITQEDLDAFLKGEVTREELDALIEENSKLEELSPDELLRKEEELKEEEENMKPPSLGGGGGGGSSSGTPIDEEDIELEDVPIDEGEESPEPPLDSEVEPITEDESDNEGSDDSPTDVQEAPEEPSEGEGQNDTPVNDELEEPITDSEGPGNEEQETEDNSGAEHGEEETEPATSEPSPDTDVGEQDEDVQESEPIDSEEAINSEDDSDENDMDDANDEDDAGESNYEDSVDSDDSEGDTDGADTEESNGEGSSEDSTVESDNTTAAMINRLVSALT